MKIYTRSRNIMYRSILLLSIVLLFALSTNGQETQPKNPLLGGWALDYTTTSNAANGKGKARFDGMDTSAKQRAASFYQGRQFIFQGNGSYQMKATGRSARTGKWSLGNGFLMLVDAADNRQLTYSLVFTNTHLVLRLEGKGAENALFRNIYLIPSI